MSAIFISHSSTDNEAATELIERLEEQGHHSVFLDFDPEQGIPPGTNWEQVLYAKLRACRAVIVLCSPHSMASKWCFAEITHARSLGKVLFPVIVAPCELKSVFSDTQILDLTDENNYPRLWRGLKEAGLEDVFEWDGKRDPYPGLNAFQAEDAALFFGRSEDIHKGIDLLRNIRRSGAERLLLYLGASGSGKSSLVRAGLVPRLKKDQNNWLVVDPFRPNAQLGDPFMNLASELSASFKRYETIREKNYIHEQLLIKGQNSHPLLLQACDLADAAGQREASVLLFIDQFEELLGTNNNNNNNNSNNRQSFLGWLGDAINEAQKIPSCPLIVIVTIRSDFFVDLQRAPELQDVDYAEFSVKPIPKCGLGELIEGPAQLAGLELEPGLVPLIIEDIETQNALPLLAFTLAELWKRYGQHGKLTLMDYKNLGGVRGSVKRAAEDAFPEEKLTLQQEVVLRRAFLAMVQVGETNQYTRKKAEVCGLPEAALPMLEKLVETRLLVKSEAGNTYEVAHESLFQEWGLLNKWLTENREFLGWRRRLQADLEKWQALKHDEGALYRGASLAEAELWFKEHEADLKETEQTFLKQSLDLRDREKHEHLEQQRKEQKAREVELRQAKELAETQKARAEEQARAAQRLRRSVYALAMVFLIAAASAVLAWNAKLIANQRAEEAKFATQAAQGARASALALVPGRATESLLMAIELVAPNIRTGHALPAQAFQGLADAIVAVGYSIPREHTLRGHTASVESVAFSPDGSRIITTGDDHTVRLWDAENLKLLKTYDRPDGFEMPGITSTSFSPGGRRIVIAGKDNVAIVLDAYSGDPLLRLAGHTDDVTFAAFSADGTRIITASSVADGTVRLWDAETGEILRSFADLGVVLFAALSPDGKLLASGGQHQKTLLWNAHTGEQLKELDEGSWVMSGAFSLNGRRLLTSAKYGSTLWDVKKGERIRGGGSLNRVDKESFTKKLIVMGSEVLKSQGSNDLLTKFPRHSGNNVNYSALSQDSQLVIAITTADSTARIWKADSGKLLAILEGHSGSLKSAAFSPYGDRAVTASTDGTARLWNIIPDLLLKVYPASIQELLGLGCYMLRNRQVFEKVRESCLLNGVKEPWIDKVSNADRQKEIRRRVATSIAKEGKQLAKKGNVDQAVVKFKAALTVDPGFDLDPEKQAKRLAAPALVKKGEKLAKKGDLDAAVVQFKNALILDPDLDLEPEKEAKRFAAPVLVKEAMQLAKKGEIKAALDAFAEAQANNPGLKISARTWNTLCWNGSLWGFATAVMDACDKAVALLPDNGQFNDGRGMARALTGDFPGAIEDFQHHIQWGKQEMGWRGGKFLSDKKIRQRQNWIEKLRAKQNPFNKELLKQLRGE